MTDPTNTKLNEAVDATETELLHEENAFALFQLHCRYYESGDKAGKILKQKTTRKTARQFQVFTI